MTPLDDEAENIKTYLAIIAEVATIPNTEIFRFYSPTKLVITRKISCPNIKK